MQKKFIGLTSEEVRKKLAEFGVNEIRDVSRTSLFRIILSQYKNLITGILFAACLFSLIIGERTDAFFIFLVLLINGMFGFLQQARAERTLEKLKNLSAPLARVLRDGNETEIEARLVVPGDIVLLREGDRVPADGKIISDTPIEIDEASLTGESLPVEKKSDTNVFMGTFIVQGRGYMKVVDIGHTTKLGKIALELGGIKRPKTPLVKNIDDLGKTLAMLGVVFALCLLPIGIIQGREVKELFVTVVSVAVAVIPEGLPLVVTLALAVGAFRLANNKTIVRKMSAIETLGATTAILTDKTGTLTQNRMTVKSHWLSDKEPLEDLLRGCVLGNTASLAMEEDHGHMEVIGDKTDGALLLYANEHVKEIDEYRKEGKILKEEPFDPTTKTIRILWENEGKKEEYVRGAPESVLELAEESNTSNAWTKFNEMAKKGLRVIALAKGTGGKYKLIGIIGIYDPPREEAKETLKKAATAGIRVVMVTGDNPSTALSIAEEIGLVKESEIVVTSDEISKLSDEALLEILPKVRIFARMKPEDKSRLVNLYRQEGYIVAVTGDGVNDALALTESHIGVAMGGTGTDVAKEAADIVIIDDNLATIVQAVEEGRGIFDNIIKVVIFLISSNVTEFALIFMGILLGLPIPLTATQILWVNLVSDTFPALALATDSRSKNLLHRKPRDVSENVLSLNRILFIAKITLPFAIILLGIYYLSLRAFPVDTARLIAFNALVVGEMVIIFIVRKGVRPLNWFMILSIALTLFLQLLTIFNPFIKSILI